jgi:hypothetical protein
MRPRHKSESHAVVNPTDAKSPILVLSP